jgi:N-sulfoglucosamine sulfohydrolase
MARFILASLIALLPTFAQAQPKAKNVVLIIADDLGLQLGCYGDTVCKTPHIDALAKRGVRFTKAYSSVASCSPSRASILTGLYTHQNGQYGLQHAAHKQECHPWVQGLPALLRAVGYWTGLIGKFHTGPDSAFPWDRLVTNTKGRDPQSFTQHARAAIKDAGKKPFFLVVGFHDPHRAGKGFGNEPFAGDPKEVTYDPKKVKLPSYLPDCDEARRDWADYLQSISRLDRGVGLIIETLRSEGVLDDTIIIFLSDNGPPFAGAKTTLYATGIHLPLIMAGPGLPVDRAADGLVSFIDVTPTVLEIAGAKTPSYKQTKLIGKSLLPVARGDDAKGRDAVFGSHQFHEITNYYPMRTIVSDRYKLTVNLSHELTYPFASDLWGSPSWQYVRTNKLKLMGQRSVETYLHRPKEELYDLANDPSELKNLASDPIHAKTLGDLRQRLRKWQLETDDPWTILYREDKIALGKAGFTVAPMKDRFTITHAGQPVADFVFHDDKILRPFFANVHAPGNLPITRHHPPRPGKDATDHDTMHPGIWLAFGDLSGHDFWRNRGRVEHVRFIEPPAVKDDQLAFVQECRLMAADKSLATLTNHITLTARPAGWLFLWDATFRANKVAVTFGDQEEMGFGARVATGFTEKDGGQIINSHGQKTAQATWGKPAAWCDYSGSLGGKPGGITLMPAPANFRESWWHNRDYGIVVANPFGRAAMRQGSKSSVTVEPGAPFRIRFGAFVHAGTGYDPAAAYRDFVDALK